MDASIGVNRRFKDETIFMGKSLQAQGFGKGSTGRASAVTAALKNEGSELVYQDETGTWHANEIGEGDSQEQTRALSQIDQSHIKLHPTLNTKQGIYNPNIIFKDDRPAILPEMDVADMSASQKLLSGNKEVAKNLLHKGKVAVSNPLHTLSDMTAGMAVNTWQTLRDPGAVLASVSETYNENKVDGMIHGVKVGASLVASAALVAGTAIAVGNLANRGFSLANGIAMEKAFAAEDPNKLYHALTMGKRDAAYNALRSRAQASAALGRGLAQAGQVTGRIGKVASVTLLGATSVSLVKNQIDLSRAETLEDFRKEVNAITQDTGSLAQSAISYGAQRLFKHLADQAKKLYTETATFKGVSPEHQNIMKQKIEKWSAEISKRAMEEIPELAPDTWQSLSGEQRAAAMTKLQQIASEIQQTPEVPILIEEAWGNAGVFSPGEKTITLGTELLSGSSIDAANILIHEQFHNLQFHIIDMFQNDPSSLSQFWTEHAEMWIDNEPAYVLANTSPPVKLFDKTVISSLVVGDVYPSANAYSDYANQPLERGAWKIGTATGAKLSDLLSAR